jgi:transcriptional regulator with XRE-family HTH domain
MNITAYLEQTKVKTKVGGRTVFRSISQAEFARRAGISTATLSLAMRGIVGISNETLDRIIQASKGKVNEGDFEPLTWRVVEEA